MIRTFRCKATGKLFNDQFVSRFQAFQHPARKKLEILNAASRVEELGLVPGNRLELLHGDREGQYSIRINDQWRLCFRWDGEPYDVEIVDYH